MVRANQTLEAARVLLGVGLHRDVVSRAYYAMFYAAKAPLSLEGVNVSKHSAVISAFGQLVNRTGCLPSHFTAHC